MADDASIERRFAYVLGAECWSIDVASPMESNQASLAKRLQQQLLAGEHFVLYGPRGSGKSYLLNHIGECLKSEHNRIGISDRTSTLNDIVAALRGAYPGVNAASSRALRTRLRLAAEQSPGILILDHVSMVSTTMLGFMRRLRGGPAGALMAVDVDLTREREYLRSWHLGAIVRRMPLTSASRINELLRETLTQAGAEKISKRDYLRLVRAASGRPGWIVACGERIRAPRYWHNGNLLTSVLTTDTEFALHLAHSGPRLRRATYPSEAN